MEEFRIYLYDKNGNLIGIYLAPSKEEFETDKLKYCSEYVEGETYISYVEINNAIIDNGVIREMKISEKSLEISKLKVQKKDVPLKKTSLTNLHVKYNRFNSCHAFYAVFYSLNSCS